MPDTVSSPPEILFVICDDVETVRVRNQAYVRSILERNDINLPHKIYTFDDGIGAANFIRGRGNARGVILISDSRMIRLNGLLLFEELSHHKLLPANCALCSSMPKKEFESLRKGLGFKGRIAFFAKSDGYCPFQDNLPAMIASAAAEIGLQCPARPQAAAMKIEREGRKRLVPT